MTIPGDAIDAVTFNLRRPERLCAALAALAEVAAPHRVEFADVERCDAALRKVRRGLTMLCHEEFSRFTRAVTGDAREKLDADVARSIEVLRAHEEAMLSWRSDALGSLEGDVERDSGTWPRASDGATASEWGSLCASER